jgi:hypothetical protein
LSPFLPQLSPISPNSSYSTVHILLHRIWQEFTSIFTWFTWHGSHAAFLQVCMLETF